MTTAEPPAVATREQVEKDIRRWKRRCFWAGFRSVWDLSGRLTMRSMRQLEKERRELIHRLLRSSDDRR